MRFFWGGKFGPKMILKKNQAFILGKSPKSFAQINEEIQEIIERPKNLKKQAKIEKEKFNCPYCGKAYKSKKYLGAKKHLLECAKANKSQKKLLSFFKKN